MVDPNMVRAQSRLPNTTKHGLCAWLLCVRNMGNFNFSLTHVLTFFHHVEQCCYLSFPFNPHIPAMTSHVAYVIHAIVTFITTQGLCNTTFSSLCLPFLSIWDRIILMFIT